MSRWFRVYDDMVDDPKVQRLGPDLFKALVNLWCLASKNNGVLPSVDDIAFKLRIRPERAEKILAELTACGLLDDVDENTTAPHNWNGRQYKSDVSNERVQRHRKRKRNVTSAVTVTPPETEADTESETEQKEPPLRGADPRTKLFNETLRTLASITGKTPDSCRSLVGRWLKSVDDEAIHVIAAIEDAERNRIADPVAWINQTLKPRGRPNGKTGNVIDAADRLIQRIAEFDAEPDIRSAAGQNPVRLLPPGRSERS